MPARQLFIPREDSLGYTEEKVAHMTAVSETLSVLARVEVEKLTTQIYHPLNYWKGSQFQRGFMLYVVFDYIVKPRRDFKGGT